MFCLTSDDIRDSDMTLCRARYYFTRDDTYAGDKILFGTI